MARSFAPSALAPLVLASSALAQTTWYVDAGATPPGLGTLASPYASIQHAIAQLTTIAGDTVLVAAGTYLETIDFLGKAIHVIGASGAVECVVDAQGAGSTARFASGEGPGSILEGITLRGGRGTGVWPDTFGGGLYVSGSSPSFVRVQITENQAGHGGGVFIANGSPTFLECGVLANSVPAEWTGTAFGAGVFVSPSASPTWTSSQISVNNWGSSTAQLIGGGLCGGGTYVQCTFFSNEAFTGAGAFANAQSLHLVGCLVRRNKTSSASGACGGGGGVVGPALIEDTVFLKNKGCDLGGGALDCTLVRCDFHTNECLAQPGAAGRGGAAARSGLFECDVLDNVAYGLPGASEPLGGGIFGGSATRTRFEHNVANGGHGGGAYEAILSRCDLFANEARPSASGASANGGGAYGGRAASCAFWSNEAGRGAGTFATTLDRCTIVENVATESGGGAFLAGAIPSWLVTSSIVRGNVPDQIFPIVVLPSVSYCDVEGGHPGLGNFDADPSFFGPVGHDYHLKAGSPCIDAGDPAVLDPDGSRADVGAFSYDSGWCGEPHVYCTGKTNSQGCVPTIEFQGTPTLSGADDFVISAGSFLNHNLGRLCWSAHPASLPFQGGTLCLGAPIARTPVLFSGGTAVPWSDCSGRYGFAATHAWLAASGLRAGSTVYAQFVARDPTHPDGTGYAFSDALEFTVCP